MCRILVSRHRLIKSENAKNTWLLFEGIFHSYLAHTPCQLRIRKVLKEQGLQSLKRKLKKDYYRKNRFSQNIEEKVIQFSLQNPHLGESEVSRQLKKELELEVARSSVRNIWLRYGVQTIALRIKRSRLHLADKAKSLSPSTKFPSEPSPEPTGDAKKMSYISHET